MAEPADRAIIEIRRRVPAGLRASYDEAWLGLRSSVEAVMGHAWRFTLREDSAQFIEFVEFRANADPRESPTVLAALNALDRLSPGTVEVFVDASAPTEKGGG